MKRATLFALAAGALLLSSCMVGPKYAKPVLPVTPAFKELRRATSDAAIANYDATVAAYRQTALTAFQQVEDNLAALRILETEAGQQRDAVAAANESLQLSANRYRGGVDTYLQVITAQTIALSDQRTEIDILRRRMEASVLLVKALGGGWDTSALPAKP